MKFFLSKSPVTYFLLLIGCMTGVVSGQVSVALVETKAEQEPGKVCYQITLTNQGKKAVALAGQNYRLYYDSEFAMMSETTIKSLLPKQYTPMKLVQHFYDVDASGFGALSYDGHLGFINLATDLNADRANGLSLPTGEAITVAEMCFDIEAGVAPIITWSQENLTHTYATAFVELALADDNGKTIRAAISDYKVVTHARVDVQEASVFTTKYFPNPFTDRLTVSFNEPLSQDATVQITDIFEKTLSTQRVVKGSKELVVSGQNMPHGALFISIKTDDGATSTMKAIHIK